MNNINLHILNASGTLTPYTETIKEEFDMAIKKVINKIPVSNVDVVVVDDPEDSIPELAEYLKKHPDKKPSDLYATPAEEFKP